MDIYSQIRLFFFVMSCIVLCMCGLHVVKVFRLESGKLITSDRNLYAFMVALSYFITVLISGI